MRIAEEVDRMKSLPLGIQNFREIIGNNHVYVDKTQYVHRLITDAKCFFLSRPRRFGKSLLLDTIAEAFSGDRELFKGLFIYNSGYAFDKHPVLRLDMSSIANDTPETLKESLLSKLNERVEEESLGISERLPSDLYQRLIKKLYEKYDKTVVILIDEYDKPILDHIDDPETAEGNRSVLRGFYGVLKSMDPYLRLAFITGVSKFTKTSVFSGMNNLKDITMLERYAGICGVPIEELVTYFNEHIEKLAQRGKLGNRAEICDKILEWYDGYSWDGEGRVINPYSLLNFLSDGKFSPYWFATGTPKFLTDIVKKRPEGYADLNDPEVSEASLDCFDIYRMPAAPILFQTGYLTVKEVIAEPPPEVYRLTIPNFEVKIAFNLSLIADFMEKDYNIAESAYRKMNAALGNGDLNSFTSVMRSLFSAIPYQLHISHEAYYHSLFYTIMNLLGFKIEAEVSTSYGRIDGVLELGGRVYIFEFKFKACLPDATPEDMSKIVGIALDEGMKQIADRGYADRYAGSGKEIIRAAFAFLGRDTIEMRFETLVS